MNLKTKANKDILEKVFKNSHHRANSLYGSDPEVKYPDAFYFRVNKDWTIYYTASKKDTVILGVMFPEKMKMLFGSIACF